jgi:hypothetical protein
MAQADIMFQRMDAKGKLVQTWLFTKNNGGAGMITPQAYGMNALKKYYRDSHMNVDQFSDFLGISRKTVWSWFKPEDPVKTYKRENVVRVLEKTGIDLGPRPRSRRSRGP